MRIVMVLALSSASLFGCVADPDPDLATRSDELEICPDSAVDGAPCRPGDRTLACERGDTLCVCDRATAVYACEVVAPPPLDPCADTVHDGTRCERVGAACTRTCDGPETCRCTGVGADGMEADRDPAGGEGAIWICEGEPPPPPPPGPECTMELIDACLAGRTDEIRCASDDGSICVCRLGDDGRPHFSCEGAPTDPPAPGDGTCTEAWHRACLEGDPATMVDAERCVRDDGSVCWCEHTADGTRSVVCEGSAPPPPPPAGDSCTDEHFARCRAGETIECRLGDRTCYCAPDSPEGVICR